MRDGVRQSLPNLEMIMMPPITLSIWIALALQPVLS